MKWTKRKGLGGLIAVNGALLAALVFVTFSLPLKAQGFRARGNYHAVSGSVPGWDAGVIYVVDETNQQLIALTFNPNTKALQGVGARDLARDAVQFGGARN